MAGPSGSTPLQNFPYPVPNDDVDVPRDIKALADALDPRVGMGACPIGSVVMWPTGAAPANWLLCAGQTNIPATTYPDLAVVLGSTGGFINMPDFTGRFPAGPGQAAGAVGETADNGAVKTAGGKAKHKLSSAEMAVHTHADGTLKVASHSHAYDRKHPAQPAGNFVGINATHGSGAFNNNFVGTDQGPTAIGTASGTAASAPDVTGATASAGGDTAHENRPPYFAINFIIRAQ